MARKDFIGQYMSKGYRTLTLYHFLRSITKSLMGIEKFTPPKKLSRHGRYKYFCKILRKADIVCPCYKPTKSGK